MSAPCLQSSSRWRASCCFSPFTWLARAGRKLVIARPAQCRARTARTPRRSKFVFYAPLRASQRTAAATAGESAAQQPRGQPCVPQWLDCPTAPQLRSGHALHPRARRGFRSDSRPALTGCSGPTQQCFVAAKGAAEARRPCIACSPSARDQNEGCWERRDMPPMSLMCSCGFVSGSRIHTGSQQWNIRTYDMRCITSSLQSWPPLTGALCTAHHSAQYCPSGPPEKQHMPCDRTKLDDQRGG